MAMYYNNTDLAKLLLDRGADVNSRGGVRARCNAAFWTHGAAQLDGTE